MHDRTALPGQRNGRRRPGWAGPDDDRVNGSGHGSRSGPRADPLRLRGADEEAERKDPFDPCSGCATGDDRLELLRRVGLTDRGDPVVDGDARPEGEAAGHGNDRERHAVTPQIEKSEAPSRHAPDLREEQRELARREVVEQEGRDDPIDRAGGHGQAEGVRGDAGQGLPAVQAEAGGEVPPLEIEAQRRGCSSRPR